MLTRSALAIAASGLAAVAAVVASADGDLSIVPFFVALTVAGGIGAWAVHEPYVGRRVVLARFVAFGWVLAATLIGALLVLYQMTCGCSMPAAPPEETYLGLTATAYHLAGVYLGGAFMAVAAFSRALSARVSAGG